jgi:hypothetical protein
MALYDLYRVIIQTPDGPTYSVKWYADEVINHLKYTEYKIFITSSRDALQTSATPYAINNMVNKFWVDNHHLWEDYEVFGAKKKKKARAFSFKGAVDGSLLCTNCGEKTHNTKKCRNEGGEKEEICYICKRAGRPYFGHGRTVRCTFPKNNNQNNGDSRKKKQWWKKGKNKNQNRNNSGKTKCTYKGCTGNRNDHKTWECIDKKIADVKKARPSAFASQRRDKHERDQDKSGSDSDS